MYNLLPYFQKLLFIEMLFQDYTFSGIMLIFVNGVTNATAFLLLCFRKKSGHIFGTIFRVTLMSWISIRFSIFSINVMSIVFFLLGFVQFSVGYVFLSSIARQDFLFPFPIIRTLGKK